MVNTDDFIKRLEIILDYYSLSASAFADSIGVQRSALSHLMSGRNKPSLDLIMKIVETHPEVDIYWLLNGKGNFPKEDNKQSRPPILPEKESNADLFSINEEQRHNEQVIEEKEIRSINTIDLTAKEIDQVMIFYTDGTFKVYKPE